MFWVKAKWDRENNVFWSESNIKGLHIEASTIDEFHQAMIELAPELIAANHDEQTPLVYHETERSWAYDEAQHGEQLLQTSG